jgi:hypothetical protein
MTRSSRRIEPRRKGTRDASRLDRPVDWEHRRNFMKWLERGHQQGEAHEHL